DVGVPVGGGGGLEAFEQGHGRGHFRGGGGKIIGNTAIIGPWTRPATSPPPCRGWPPRRTTASPCATRAATAATPMRSPTPNSNAAATPSPPAWPRAASCAVAARW